MPTRSILTVGFIPDDWVSSRGNSQRISAGDPDTSNTTEFDVVIIENDDSILSLLWPESQESRVMKSNELWDTNSPFYAELTNRIMVDYGVGIDAKTLCQLWHLFQGELEDDVGGLILVAENDDHSEFTNHHGVHNGCVYVRYIHDEDGEVYDEQVVVIRP